jgi:Zn-dependent protease with chaperone function
MGVKLERVYVVPSGRGHLTNAFAGGASIFLTDNLGKELDKREIDSVIAHELGHLVSGHARKKFLQTMAIYAMTILLLFVFRRSLTQIRPMLEVLVVFGPLATFYFFSRKHEFEADRKEVEFTGDPERAIRALAGIYALSAAPIRYSRFAEIFSTHPSFERRARAMARWGEMPAERVSEILRRGDAT